ncbi:hypothetical protein BKA56DRAFT_166544 [Ilyonectria sp. MPI-CAGE-AT-0026]|nr:hypothetical protein BKA56DRAFT_166544 [Ilyonectria sp. MPI-CAGE-AT-0026]
MRRKNTYLHNLQGHNLQVLGGCDTSGSQKWMGRNVSATPQEHSVSHNVSHYTQPHGPKCGLCEETFSIQLADILRGR